MNKHRKKLQNAMHCCTIVFLILLVAVSARAQTSASAPATNDRSDARSLLALVSRFRRSFVPPGSRSMPANNTRTTDFNRSSVSPDRFAEMIETTLGGLKFPDGTAQNASAAKSPLFTLAHDETLQGDGTSTSPLGIKIPLILNGALSLSGELTVGGLIKATSPSGNAVEANGGVNPLGNGADGVIANGGVGQGDFFGGLGVRAQGGFPGGGGVVSTGGQGGFLGGNGIQGNGGNGTNGGFGGKGVLAIGGDSDSGRGGIGAQIKGGDSSSGTSGIGLDVTGGGAFGINHVSGAGIVAQPGVGFNGASRGLAGDFIGNVQIEQGDLHVSGNLSKGGGSFKIDHPLDPENKYLYHSFVESPDMMNIYNGTITTDTNGEATVTLPDWLEALNQDFRYQLTVIGIFAQAIVAQEIKGNRFVVKTNAPNVKVSWQVTGIRHDAYANKHRIPVEEQKSDEERGLFLHPDAFNQPEEKSVVMVRHPEISRRIKEASEKAQREKLQ